MMSFIHSGSEIATWMEHSFNQNQAKAQNPKQHKITTSFLFWIWSSKSLKGHWSCTPTHWNSCFYSYTYEKTYYLALHFTKRCFFCQFVDRKVTGLGPNYYLLPGDTSQVSIFSLYKIKMSKQNRLFIF